jgi:hypothetical protein
VCTDGASALTGEIKGFLAFVKKLNPTLITTHCFLHRKALMTKSVDGGQLAEVLSTVVSMINYIKTRPASFQQATKLHVFTKKYSFLAVFY